MTGGLVGVKNSSSPSSTQSAARLDPDRPSPRPRQRGAVGDDGPIHSPHSARRRPRAAVRARGCRIAPPTSAQRRGCELLPIEHLVRRPHGHSSRCGLMLHDCCRVRMLSCDERDVPRVPAARCRPRTALAYDETPDPRALYGRRDVDGARRGALMVPPPVGPAPQLRRSAIASTYSAHSPVQRWAYVCRRSPSTMSSRVGLGLRRAALGGEIIRRVQ